MWMSCQPRLTWPPAAQALHEEAPENQAFDWGMGDEVATRSGLCGGGTGPWRWTVDDNRIIVNSMEPRGSYAEWVDGRLHVAQNGQGVWVHKGYLQCKAFGLELKIRCG